LAFIRHTHKYRIMQKIGLLRSVVVIGLLLVFGSVSQVYAEMSSGNYSVDETQFGTGSSLDDCSASYCAKTSAGGLTVGDAKSDNYSAQFGFNTTDQPLLEVITQPGNQDLGILDVDSGSVTTSYVKVRNYVSNGYTIQITGSPPKIKNHTLQPIAVADVVRPGTEQFGINLVANNSPTVGENPMQIPSGTFSFGTVADGYKTPNYFQYNDGDVVAQSLESSGQTEYTISMIFNISNVTPGGQYKSDLSAVVVPVY
jgi:hypothetical protein